MYFRHLAAILAIISLAACTSTSPTKSGDGSHSVAASHGQSAEEIVAHNAKARWDAIVAKDFDAAYAYLTPGTRATTSPEAYARRLLNASISWTGAEVKDVTCEDAEVCSATVMVDYKVPGASPGLGRLDGFAPVHEQWLLSDGQWYHLPATTGR